MNRFSTRPLLLMALYVGVVMLLTLEGNIQVRNWSLQRLQAQGAERLLSNISQLRRALDKYRYLPFVLTQSREVQALLRLDAPQEAGQVNRYLEQIALVAGSSVLLVLDLEGRLRASSNWRDQRTLLAHPQGNQAYFLQALAGEEGRQFVHQGEASRPTLYLSAPIYDRQQLTGVAAIRLELDRLREQLPIDYPFMITDLEGKLLFSEGLRGPLSALNDERLQDGTRVQLLEMDGCTWLQQGVVLDDLGWEVSVLIDARGVEQQQRISAASIAGSGMALALLLLYLREKRQKRAAQREQARERALSEERQRDMISTAQVGLINVDTSGLIQFINPMAMQQFGVALEGLRNRPVEQLLQAGHASELLRETLSHLGRPGFRPLPGIEMEGRRADGSVFPMLVSVRGMADHPELGYLITVIDITRRKRLEQALREANESLELKVAERTSALEAAQTELVQAGKLAALGRMSASVVHELNQPLTALRTWLAISRRQLDDPRALGNHLQQMEGLIDRMALITGQLKTFAYRKPEQAGLVPVARSIDQVLALFRGRFEEMALVPEYCPPDEHLQLAGDQARFEQVLINLIKNACDAMQPMGGAHQLGIRVVAEREWVQIRVEDNGPGIAPEHLPQLFEPFFTTKEVGTGLGLGLAIVHSIVRDLGGHIRAENRPQGGACFEVRLRRHVQQTPPLPPADPQKEKLS